jgi:hypothetical protein
MPQLSGEGEYLIERSKNMIAKKELVVPDTQAHTQRHIQSHEQGKDGATLLKRQKMRRSMSERSTYTVYEHRRAGQGKLDVTGCVTEKDYKKRIEDFWAPPDLGFRRKSTFNTLKNPEQSEEFSDEEKANQYQPRRHSHEIISPRTPESMSPIPSPPMTAYTPRTPDSFSGNFQSSRVSDDVDITKRLEGLFVTPEDDQGAMLGPSTWKKERLAKQAKEREAKERTAALHAARERRLTRRNPLRPLVRPLSARWEEMVSIAQHEPSQTKVLVKAIQGTELRRKDFLTLLGNRSWLNDEIINAYLEWIEDAANQAAISEAKAAGEPISDVPKFIAHNSFFYETLINKGPNQTERLMKRRKAPGKTFMQVDTMFVPICKGRHWTVGIVRPVAKTIEYFDSMGGTGERDVIPAIRKWLKFQLKDAYVEDEWKVPRTGCAVQNNSYDCGVFLCTNAFCVAFGLDTSCYTERDMTQQRRNIAAVLLNKGFVGDFAWGMSGL